jgi:protein-tyrosine phosphatase
VGEVRRSGFVDCHSHVLPSGDDGAQTLEEGLELCAGAAAHGTALLYATPHVWPHLPLTDEREQAVRAAFAELRERAPLEVRLGFELTPTRALLDDDPRRYALDGIDAVLIEIPFAGAADLFLACAEHIEEARLTPVVAHPERTEALRTRPELAEELAERGWLLQVNATSLLGRHGDEAAVLGWSLVENDAAALVASDGHRAARPPELDAPFAAVRARVGERARRMFDGSALGLASRRPLPSRAAARGA